MSTLPLMLACTDGSPASQGAMNAALALAPRWPARLAFFQVLEFNPGFASQALDFIHIWEEEVRARLADLKEQAAARGVPAEIRVVRGEAAFRAILAAAAELTPELIIMGRRGHTGLSRILMGSAAARVVGLAPAPVLLVPREAPLTFRRLLVASDGSPHSQAAWDYALKLGPQLGAELLALSVAPEFRDIPEAEAIVRDMLAGAARRGLAPRSLVVEGRPEEAVVQAAAAHGADLIVMGSRGRTGLTRLLLGSVAERVIGLAACPVLVVKPPGEAGGAPEN